MSSLYWYFEDEMSVIDGKRNCVRDRLVSIFQVSPPFSNEDMNTFQKVEQPDQTFNNSKVLINEFCVIEKRRSTDLEALELSNVRSGGQLIFFNNL